MKKLFALLVVAGMCFVSCNNTPKEEPVQAEEIEVVDETTADEAADEAAETPAEEVAE